VGISLILALGLQAKFLTNYTNFILLLLYVLTVPLYYLLAVRQRTRRPVGTPEPARS
jgi:hypothetical protein